MVWATTATINARSTLASVALAAYSAAAVARSESAVTDYDDFITDAHAQVIEALRQRGISESDVSYTTGVARAETSLVLALLFESVQQFARDGSGDVYAQQAKFYRADFEREMARAQPIDGVKGAGSTFSWGRSG